MTLQLKSEQVWEEIEKELFAHDLLMVTAVGVFSCRSGSFAAVEVKLLYHSSGLFPINGPTSA